MSKKDIIIIGAGIAGLTTACYAKMNGFNVRIFEMHDKPGGVCTSWKRKGYTFDYCIHNLAGTCSDSNVAKIWNDIGALDNTEIINHDPFVRIENTKGDKLDIYTSLDKLKKHLLEISPEDKKHINKLIKTARSFVNFDFYSASLDEGFIHNLKMMMKLPSIMKAGKLTIDEFAQGFKNPFIREAFPHAQYNMAGLGMPILPLYIFLSRFEKNDLGWVKGGSLVFSRNVEKKIRELGIEINYKSPVEKVLVENNIAKGIILKDGTKHIADIVISAADGYFTIYKMLDGKYTNQIIDNYYESIKAVKTQPFGLQVYLGINRKIENVPHATVLMLDKPITLEGTERTSLYIVVYDEKNAVAPAGKSVIKVETDGNYFFWNDLRERDIKKYKDEKELVYQKVIEILEKKFPGIKEQIEVHDVSTPATAQRFTNNFHGWQPGPPSEKLMKVMKEGLSKTLPGLDNFYMVGHWANTMIGVSNVAIMAHNLAKEICNKDGICFKSSV